MTSLFAARRAAEEFAELIERPGADVADRHDTLQAVVTLLRSQPRIEARSAFVADLRAELMAAADLELKPAAPLRLVGSPAQARPTTAARPRRFGSVAAAALVIVGGGAGIATAAQGALPGDGLYSVKRGIESASVALNTSDAGKGTDLLRQASTRLDEVEALAASGAEPARIRAALDDFAESAGEGAGLLFTSYAAQGQSSDIATVRDFAADQLAALNAISDVAPADHADELSGASELLSAINSQALALCAGCGGGDQDFSSFDDVSSAAALQALISKPAATKPTADAAPVPKGETPKDTPQPTTGPAPTGGPTADPTPDPTPEPSVLPPAPTDDAVAPVKDALSGVTDPVAELVDQIGQGTGLTGITDPLTGLLGGLGN